MVETIIGLRKRSDDLHLEAKAWLKGAVRDLVPPEVILRPKRPFVPPAPLGEGLILAEHGGQLVDGYLVQAGVLSAEAARRLRDMPGAMTGMASLPYKALVLETWCREMQPYAAAPMPAGAAVGERPGPGREG